MRRADRPADHKIELAVGEAPHQRAGIAALEVGLLHRILGVRNADSMDQRQARRLDLGGRDSGQPAMTIKSPAAAR